MGIVEMVAPIVLAGVVVGGGVMFALFWGMSAAGVLWDDTKRKLYRRRKSKAATA